MFSAFQSNAFQSIGYQIVREEDNQLLGKAFFYQTPRQRNRIEQEKNEKIRRDKTDLERIESVLRENYRKKSIAAQNALIAKDTRRAIQLAEKEQEFLQEINRLLAVRAELMRRIRESEQIIIMLVLMRKRRLRVAV